MKKITVEKCFTCSNCYWDGHGYLCRRLQAIIADSGSIHPNCPLPNDRTEELEAELAKYKKSAYMSLLVPNLIKK